MGTLVFIRGCLWGGASSHSKETFPGAESRRGARRLCCACPCQGCSQPSLRSPQFMAGGAQGRLCQPALPHGLEHGFPKILEPEDQLQVHSTWLHDWGRKGDVSCLKSLLLMCSGG